MGCPLEVSVDVHAFPNAALAHACPNQVGALLLPMKALERQPIRVEKRRGATVSVSGNLVYLEDLPAALAAIFRHAAPARLALRSRLTLHSQCPAHANALSAPEAGSQLASS